ncbi:MAG: acetyl-CoA carboxylase biotin carboxyl carrier protein subunit [Eubacterium sp.]|nr:acetyl-CoA carboxylase biotin carboxyl carrier protein subunit [Eubacterium sp.]
MKNYRIIVNGVSYDVAVQELSETEAPAAMEAPVPAAPAPKAAAKKAAAGPAGGEGSVKINSPMPGKIVAIKAQPGSAVKKGDVILVLEAMKMENEIPAPQDGTLAGINVSVGDQVEGGSLLATMN